MLAQRDGMATATYCARVPWTLRPVLMWTVVCAGGLLASAFA